jgi:hypothetical protein
VGRSFKSSEAVRLQVHFLNTTEAPMKVSAGVTVTYVAPEQVAQLAAGIFVYSASLQVPPGASTQSFSYKLLQDMNFLQVTGHMHHRGQRYRAQANFANGETKPFYASDTWDEPATLNFAQPFAFKTGDTIDYACDFLNETAKPLVYGESAATNEMCNMFGVFYPAVDGQGVIGTL